MSSLERGWSRLWLPAPLPGLNELIEAQADRIVVNGKVVGTKYREMKRKLEANIGICALAAGLRRGDFLAGHFTYVFFESSRRRDPSNITAGGIKIIEDALQALGVVENDGWKHVLSISSYWLLRKECPGVLVLIGPRRLSLVEAQQME